MNADRGTQRVAIDRIVVAADGRGRPPAGAPDPIVSALADLVEPETASAVAREVWTRLSEGRR